MRHELAEGFNRAYSGMEFVRGIQQLTVRYSNSWQPACLSAKSTSFPPFRRDVALVDRCNDQYLRTFQKHLFLFTALAY